MIKVLLVAVVFGSLEVEELSAAADCGWRKMSNPVIPDGNVVPTAKSLQSCKRSCEETMGCTSFDWEPGEERCYLPCKPTGHRYQLVCSGPTTTQERGSMTTEEGLLPELPVIQETSTLETTSLWPALSTIGAKDPTTPQTTSPLLTTTSTALRTLSTASAALEAFSTVPVCKRRLDLAFIVDGSGSICNVISSRNYNGSCDDWEFNVKFIRKMIQRLTIGPDDSRVALVKFATSVKVEWGLNNYTDKSELISAVDNLSYPTGMTNTSGALMALVNDVFTPAAGDRPNVPNRAILITDGDPNVETIPLPNAIKAVHNNGIKIFVVGVTKYVKEKTLKDISSPPQRMNETYFVVKDYCSIDLVLEQLLEESCIL